MNGRRPIHKVAPRTTLFVNSDQIAIVAKKTGPGLTTKELGRSGRRGLSLLSSARAMLDRILFRVRSGRPHRKPEAVGNHLNKRQRALPGRSACCAKVRP